MADTDPQQALIDLLSDLVREARGRPPSPSPTLDTRLDRDLGLDSLARGELLQRLEHHYGVRLPASAMAASSAAELWQAIREARGQPAETDAPMTVAPLGDAQEIREPVGADTLNDVLHWHATHHPRRDYALIHDDSDDPPVRLSMRDLHDGAERMAGALQALGIGPGDTVALMLPTGVDYFLSFFGCLLAGAVAIPLYPPTRPSQLEEHLQRHGRILDNAGCRCLITVPAARRLGQWFSIRVDSLTRVVVPADLRNSHAPYRPPTVTGEHLAFLQYTSGSTGDPKGVMLSHANLLANIRAAGRRVGACSTDVFVSWLPLYHDMGLIGSALFTLYHGIPAVVLSPLTFLRRPLSWLEAVDRHRGTFSAAPNFAFERCLRDIDAATARRLDLSRWRYLLNGAEPVNPDTMRRFAGFFGVCGLRPEALSPSYGLAENTVALALPPAGRGLRVETVDRALFRREGIARAVAGEGSEVLTLVGCGHAIAGHQIRVVDATGQPLPDRHEGELEFRGPSATAGYYRREDATRVLRHGQWWRTGDRGLLMDGEVFITGRIKDLMIRHGRNLYPYELERAVGQLTGIRRGCVAVFASQRQDAEVLVLAAETRERDPVRRRALEAQIQSLASDWLEGPLDEVALVAPHTVLKTSSGKIRRAAMAELYRQGVLGRPPRALWWQLTRLALAGLGQRLRRAGRWLRGLLGQWRAGPVVGFGALVCLLLLTLLPTTVAWSTTRRVARLTLRLAGIRIRLAGLEHLHPPCLLAINHASYLDGPLVLASLPQPVRFVAKQELADSPLLGPSLRKLRVLFVERFDLARSRATADQLVAAVMAGEVLAIFPEGTFAEQAGILPFRDGGFIAAARAGVAVVPVVLKGTREALPPAGGLPRPAAVSVTVLPALSPAGADWAAAVALRDRVRAAIVAASGEPALDEEDSPLAALAARQRDQAGG